MCACEANVNSLISTSQPAVARWRQRARMRTSVLRRWLARPSHAEGFFNQVVEQFCARSCSSCRSSLFVACRELWSQQSSNCFFRKAVKLLFYSTVPDICSFYQHQSLGLHWPSRLLSVLLFTSVLTVLLVVMLAGTYLANSVKSRKCLPPGKKRMVQATDAMQSTTISLPTDTLKVSGWHWRELS